MKRIAIQSQVDSCGVSAMRDFFYTFGEAVIK